MPLEEQKLWVIFVTSQNIQISPVTSYLFPFILACKKKKKN